MNPARSHLLRTYTAIVRALDAAYKTEAYYERALNRAVLDFYQGGDAGAFIDKMLYLIDEQFGRAWREGARDVGYNPQDFTEEDDAVLQERINAEREFILDYADRIEKAREAGDPVKPFQDRVSLWAGRYNEVRDQARAHFGGKEQMLIWRVGPTEHCDTCQTLDGTIAPASEWEEAHGRGIYPKSPELDCHGFRCQCELYVTDAKRPTEGGIPF